MATAKVKFRPSSVDGGEGTVYYQIIHNRVPRRINTEYRMYPGEWCRERSAVSVSGDKDRAKGVSLSVISEGMGHDNEKTTEIYLASLETSEVDKANGYIISLL